MFRALICPSSGVCDYVAELPHWLISFYAYVVELPHWLKMGILMSETYSVSKKKNKNNK